MQSEGVQSLYAVLQGLEHIVGSSDTQQEGER